MNLEQTLDIGIWVTGIISLLLILGALFFEWLYHKIDTEMKYEGKGKKFLDRIAIFIDKNINHTTGIIWYLLWATLLWYLDTPQLLIIWAISMLAIYIFVWLLKWVSKKKRPSDARFTLKDFSFPSGHTALATTGFLNFALFISIFGAEKYWHILVFFGVASIGGMIVGRSRRYLRVHRISDVLVGLLLGGFCFLLACSIVLL